MIQPPGDPEVDFKPGLYMHAPSGGLYTAVCLVRDDQTGNPMVLYLSHTYGNLSVRPLYGWPGNEKAWRDLVELPAEDGAPTTVHRFQCIGGLPSDTPAEKRWVGVEWATRVRQCQMMAALR